MKKFLLSLGVAALALSANAQIYLVGDGEELGWDLPGKAIAEKSANVYEFSVNNLVAFKVSTAQANPGDWDTFNAGAYATGANSFSAAGVSSASGQTLPVEPWGENQMVPYKGNYTITLDLNAMTMTAKTTTPAPTTAPDVYVRGDMNSWNPVADWQFKYNANYGMYYFVAQGNTAIVSGQKFKFADDSWGNVNYSTNGEITVVAPTTKMDLVFNQGDSYLSESFTGMIYLKVEGQSSSYVIFQPNVFEYDNTVSVGEVMVDNGEAVYYNLQGQKVANPDRGIFVKVQNGKAVKVVK